VEQLRRRSWGRSVGCGSSSSSSSGVAGCFESFRIFITWGAVGTWRHVVVSGVTCPSSKGSRRPDLLGSLTWRVLRETSVTKEHLCLQLLSY
jgi:hypothetical protein